LTVPAEHGVVLGLAARGPVALFGPGVPDDLATGDERLRTDALVDAAVAAQDGEHAPVIVLGAGCGSVARVILDQPHVRRAWLLLLGTGDAGARAELEAIPWRSWPRVRHVDLEYVPPRLVEDGPGFHRLERGLGLVVLDADEAKWTEPGTRFVPIARLLPDLRSPSVPARIAADELAQERERRERADAVIRDLTSSASWRITAPLRAAKRAVARRRG
jgi:hypothetical protein